MVIQIQVLKKSKNYKDKYIAMMITVTKVKAIHIPYPTPAPPHTYTQAMSTSPLSYLSLVVDIRPSVQQHLHNGEMPIPRGPVKGRVPTLHHIDRHG